MIAVNLMYRGPFYLCLLSRCFVEKSITPKERKPKGSYERRGVRQSFLQSIFRYHICRENSPPASPAGLNKLTSDNSIRALRRRWWVVNALSGFISFVFTSAVLSISKRFFPARLSVVAELCKQNAEKHVYT